MNRAFVDEESPFSVYAKMKNPPIPFVKGGSGDKTGGIDWFISPRNLTMVCMSGLVCLLIVLIVLGMFFCLRRNSKKRKDSPYFSSVYYSRANSLHENSGNFNHELTLIRNSDSFPLNVKNLDQVSQDNHLPTNADLDEQLVAPNVQIMPSNNNNIGSVLYQQQTATVVFKTQSHARTGKAQNIEAESVSSLNNDTDMQQQYPGRLRACDICLIEKIAQGQFSSVWKSRCHSSLQDKEAPEYAIKVFSSYQKTAWSNEKDIYNSMQSLNNNVLKYFGSDVSEGRINSRHVTLLFVRFYKI